MNIKNLYKDRSKGARTERPCRFPSTPAERVDGFAAGFFATVSVTSLSCSLGLYIIISNNIAILN